MSPSKYPAQEYFVAKGDAHAHAMLGVATDTLMGLPGLETWQRASLKRQPVEIYDINGDLLFRDHPVTMGNLVLGTVRTAASRVLGEPVVSISLGPQAWDYKAAVAKLRPLVAAKRPGWKITATNLVCYSYPKLGVMFTLTNGDRSERLIFDVASLEPVPEVRRDNNRDGTGAWSFYDDLSDDERAARIERFGRRDAERGELALDVKDDLLSLVHIRDMVGQIKPGDWLGRTRHLAFCSHYGSSEPRSHHSFVLHGQQKDDYCAVATCEMILCYYRYYFTQDQIAPALGYTAGNGCDVDQSPGYKNLTCGHLDASFDATPTFSEAVNEIDGLRPFKSGIPRHARACAGYSFSTWLPEYEQQRKLYIYDPWPWRSDYKLGGSIVWENWDSVIHRNHVYARLVY